MAVQQRCAKHGCPQMADRFGEGWCLEHRYGKCEFTPGCGGQAAARVALSKTEMIATAAGMQPTMRYAGNPLACEACIAKHEVEVRAELEKIAERNAAMGMGQTEAQKAEVAGLREELAKLQGMVAVLTQGKGGKGERIAT